MSGDIGEDVNNFPAGVRAIFSPSSWAIQQLSPTSTDRLDNDLLINCENCRSILDDTTLYLLACLHIVCKQCASVTSTAVQGAPYASSTCERSICPICGEKFQISNDILFSNLLEKLQKTNQSSEEFDICANCEKRIMTEDLQFCKVCRERLCNECKIATHSAKMFTSHIFETSLQPRLEPIPCCHHPERSAVIANLIQNNFVCVDCFSDFDEDSKSSCVEFNSAIQNRTSQVADILRALQSQEPQINDRLTEVEKLFVDLQESYERKMKEVSSFADKLVREIRLVENQMLKKFEKDLKVNEDAVGELRAKVSFFGSSLGLYSKLFGIMTSTFPDKNFLTWTSEIKDRLMAIESLKSQCLTMKLVNVLEFGTDFKGSFKKSLFETFCNDVVSPGKIPSVDSFQLQNLALMRSLSAAPVNIQQILAYHGMPRGFDLSSVKLARSKNESTNSSSRSSSSLNNKLCKEVEDIRRKFKNLGLVFANNARRVQSLQLDVTRRKVYPKRQEAEIVSLDVEKFLNGSDELITETNTVVSNLEIGYIAANSENSPDFDKEYNIEKCKTIISEVEILKQKHERIRQILKSIKPYISSVTLQKEKSSYNLVPSVHADYIDDLKRNVVVTDQVTEQRIHAIEAMYKSQSAEKSTAVNNSEIHKALQLTKQKLKKSRVLSYEDVSETGQLVTESTAD